MKKKRIDENLVLNFIEENLSRDGKLVTVEMSFTFFTKVYLAYLKVDSIQGKLNFIQIEGPGILLEAFEQHIEDEDVENLIRVEVKAFVDKWIKLWEE